MVSLVEKSLLWGVFCLYPTVGKGLLSVLCCLTAGGSYHEEVLFSVCRVMVSPSLLQTNSKSSFSSSSLLLKAFKQQRLGCLPTWVLGCQGNTYRWSPPSVSVFLAPTRWKEARVSKQPAACCAGSASFQLKAFCAACAATWRGKGSRWEWLERREGE